MSVVDCELLEALFYFVLNIFFVFFKKQVFSFILSKVVPIALIEDRKQIHNKLMK